MDEPQLPAKVGQPGQCVPTEQQKTKLLSLATPPALYTILVLFHISQGLSYGAPSTHRFMHYVYVGTSQLGETEPQYVPHGTGMCWVELQMQEERPSDPKAFNGDHPTYRLSRGPCSEWT